MQTSRRTMLKAAASAGLVGLGVKSTMAQSGTFNYKVATNVPVTHPIFIRLTEAVEKIKALGGTIALPKMPIPHVGWLAYGKDTEGNIFGVMQADPNAA